MSNLTIPDLPAITNATTSDEIPAYQSSTGKLTIAKILALVLGTATSPFDTLGKLENGKLSVDGSQPMAGDLDMDGNDVLNESFAGKMVKSPTFVTITTTDWPYDSKTRFAVVEVLGAGSGGAGAVATTSSQASAGAGGNAGAYGVYFKDVSAMSVRTADLTIGAAGTGSSGAAGSAGGSSIYTDEAITLTAAGGSASGSPSATAVLVSGNTDGIVAAVTTGSFDYSISGEASIAYLASGTTDSSTNLVRTGRGGSTKYGRGGKDIGKTTNSSFSKAGIDAQGYGSGGGGGVAMSGAGAVAGGNGTQGLIIITEFY